MPCADPLLDVPSAIVHDLSKHAWEKMRPALMRAILLADNETQRTQIAVLVAGHVIGTAAGVFGASNNLPLDDVDIAAIAILELLLERFRRRVAASAPSIARSE